MSIYVGTSEIKNVYVGTTPVKEVYVGTTKVRPIGYTPNANTLLYLPFNGDLSNSQGKSITGTGISYESTGINKSVKLTSTSGSITGPGNLMSSVGTGDYTVSLRVKPTNGGNPLVFGNWYESSPYPSSSIYFIFGTSFGVTNKVIGLVETPKGTQKKITSTMSATSLVGSWHHIVLTRISGVVYLYIDNTLQGQLSYTGTTANYNYLIILNRGGSGQSWTNAGALMDELVVEKAGWTVNDISNYYNQTKSNYGL